MHISARKAAAFLRVWFAIGIVLLFFQSAASAASRELREIHDGLVDQLASFHPSVGRPLGITGSALPSSPDSYPRQSIRDYVVYLESVEQRLASLGSSPNVQLSAQERIDLSLMSRIVREQLHSIADPKETLSDIAKGKLSVAAFLAKIRDQRLLPTSDDIDYARVSEEYAWRLKNNWGILQSPQELHEQGLDLARDIRQQMNVLAKHIDPSKDMQGVIQDIYNWHPANDEQLFAAYAAQSKKARDFVVRNKFFDISLDDHSVRVLPTPLINRQISPVANYSGRDGAFRITPTDGDPKMLAMHNFSVIPSIVAHEAFPGHAVQHIMMMAAGRNVSPIGIRRFLRIKGIDRINLEGYAFYAEELMREYGFFSPAEELMELEKQLWRAYRLALDAGLHIGKIGPEEAFLLLQEKAGLPERVASAEVGKYLSRPMNAIAYMLGRLQIEDLKRDYKAILGPDFKEAQFHRALLSFGPVPPLILGPVMLEEARLIAAGDPANLPR